MFLILPATLADAKTWSAWDRGELEIALSAVSEIENANQSMSESPLVHRTEILVFLSLLNLAPRDDPRKNEWTANAQSAAESLEASYYGRGDRELAAWHYHLEDKQIPLGMLRDICGFVHQSFRNAVLLALQEYDQLQPAGAIDVKYLPRDEATELIRRAIARKPSSICSIWLPLDLDAVSVGAEAKQK